MIRRSVDVCVWYREVLEVICGLWVVYVVLLKVCIAKRKRLVKKRGARIQECKTARRKRMR